MKHAYGYIQKDTEQHPLNKNISLVKKMIRFWYLPLLVLLIFLFSEQVIFIGTLGLMVVSAALISFYKKIIQVSLGLELISFYAIVLSIAFSPVAGIIFAIALLFIEFAIQNNFCSFFFVKAAVYILLCILAPVLAPLGIAIAGIILILVRNAIFGVLTYLHNPARLVMDAPGIVINIALGTFLFREFGGPLLSVFL